MGTDNGVPLGGETQGYDGDARDDSVVEAGEFSISIGKVSSYANPLAHREVTVVAGSNGPRGKCFLGYLFRYCEILCNVISFAGPQIARLH